ncbi:MAG TPA: response regulator transcription factor [Anaerolineales bacterium]
MKKIRILVVDDENVIREGIVTMLRLQQDMQVVGEGTDGLQAVTLAKKTKPDVVLLDLQMPKQDGLETIPELVEAVPDAKILVLTGYAQHDKVYQAVKSGALGYLLKDATRVQLLQAIRDVAAGVPSIPPSIAVKVIQEIDHPTHAAQTADPLAPRELDTLRLIARGMSNNEIANELGVHPRTVAKYVSGILRKLQLASRTQAALYAVREGLTEPRPKK